VAFRSIGGSNVNIAHSNAATSIATKLDSSFVYSTLITVIDSSQPEADDKVTRRSSATDFANPTFTRRCRKTSKKFPATPSLLIRPSHFITAAMLPSRGIVRSLPSGAFQRPLRGQSVCRA
jgi:hypothetical protein